MASISQAQIAKKLNVSRSAVSAVLSRNANARISKETARRILQAAKDLNYRHNRYAVAMRKGKTGLIGLMYGTLPSPIHTSHERLLFASRAIQQSGYRVMALASDWLEGGIEEAETSFAESRVEAVLISGIYNLTRDGAFKILESSGIPYVVLSGRQIASVPLVRCNVRQSFYELTRLLLESGRKHLALLLRNRSGSHLPGVNWAMEDRVAGFKRAVLELGGTLSETRLKLNDEEVPFPVITRGHPHGEIVHFDELFQPESIDWHRPGKEAMALLIKRGTLPDAVMGANDYWAIGALSACTDAGLSIPGDIAITGFDNTPEAAYTNPSLTTIAQPNELMAKQAVDLLISQIKEPQEAGTNLYEWLGKIVIRKSCGIDLQVTATKT